MLRCTALKAECNEKVRLSKQQAANVLAAE
jgi:hypothetical protein